MEYRKERNFMVAYDEAGNMRGKWDILTNTFIGVKGNTVKNAPVAFSLSKLCMPDYLHCAMQFIHDWFIRPSYGERPYTNAIANRIEQLLSLQLSFTHSYSTIFFLQNDKTALTKDLVEFIRAEENGVYSETAILRYQFMKKNKDFLDKIDENHRQWATDILRHEFNKKISKDFIKGMIMRGVHEKVFHQYASYIFIQVIENWYRDCVALGYEVEVKHNILTNYAILEYLYEEDKAKNCDKHIMEFNNLPWLYFENDDYIVRPLLSKEEFHAEATAQRNCVERMYMERVADGTTHVVAVRKKSAPDAPYITCEVNNQGSIRQYLRKCNNLPTDEKDRLFRITYQNHLNASLSIE